MATGGLQTDAGRTGIGIEFETDSPTHIASFSNSSRRLGDIWVAKIRGRAHLEVKLAMSVLIDKRFISQERRQRVDMPQSPRSSERWPARPLRPPPPVRPESALTWHGVHMHTWTGTCTRTRTLTHIHTHTPVHIHVHAHVHIQGHVYRFRQIPIRILINMHVHIHIHADPDIHRPIHAHTSFLVWFREGGNFTTVEGQNLAPLESMAAEANSLSRGSPCNPLS